MQHIRTVTQLGGRFFAQFECPNISYNAWYILQDCGFNHNTPKKSQYLLPFKHEQKENNSDILCCPSLTYSLGPILQRTHKSYRLKESELLFPLWRP